MANEQVFCGRADDYVKGRAGYAPGAIDLLCNELLEAGRRIADVGSGTGIFAGELIARGYDVFCVEPNEEMRRQAEQAFHSAERFISVPGTAEATTLPDASVDMVTAASALHWFDFDSFCAEARRILKPGGLLFTIANGRDYSDPFTCRQHELCQGLCPGFTSLRHGLDKSASRLAAAFGSRLHHAGFDFPLEYTKEKFIRRSLSSSYAPDPGTRKRELYTQRLWELMERAAPDGPVITVPNRTEAYWVELT